MLTRITRYTLFVLCLLPSRTLQSPRMIASPAALAACSVGVNWRAQCRL